MISKLIAVVDPIASGLAYISNFESLLRSVEAGPGHDDAGSTIRLPDGDKSRDLQSPLATVSNILANARRRRIIEALSSGGQRTEDIASIVGPSNLEYHLSILERAGLVHSEDGLLEIAVEALSLVSCGLDESPGPKGLSGIGLFEVADISQLLPCPGDPSMFRITARLFPPPSDGIRALKAVFPMSRYSDRMKALVIPRKNMRITLYSSGNVSAVMLRSIQEAQDALFEIRDAINHAVKAASKKGRRIDHMEINHLLCHTNCGECGERSCYCFAIKLAEGEAALEMCAPLKEARHSAKAERLREILS